tara:strand:+ start:48 stop:1406 length:1359 start_codon:yes stop_codon:yes gene_type:complete
MFQPDSEAVDYVLHKAAENDVKFIRLWFTDILGSLKGVAVTVEELESALTRGMGFDGSSIEGFARSSESDMYALPDPTTFSVLPWRPRTNAVARMFCDILTPSGDPFDSDPRSVLKRNVKRAADLGYTYYLGPEIEYFYFKNSNDTEPLDEGGYFDQTPQDLATDLRRETVLMLEDLGIPVESSHHEVAASQHEIDLRHTDALTMADTVMTYRLVVKEIAMNHGCYATFMPKPVYGVNGSGMHVHQSLFEGDRNAFYDPSDSDKLSDIARHFMAGLLKHAPEITSITNQWVNSYKRLVRSGDGDHLGYEAPVYVSWANVNHADLVRVPAFKSGREMSRRIEYRAPDPACNPYLAFSVMLAAGLEGIENEYPLSPPIETDVHKLSKDERESMGVGTLPGNLWEAIRLTEESELVNKALGKRVLGAFIENKQIEWERYSSHVTDYETKEYLPIL